MAEHHDTLVGTDHCRRAECGSVIVVRGTKKFLARVGRPSDIELESDSQLGDWYANAWFWRPQVAVFVNERSRVPVLLPLAPASSVLARFPSVFAEVAGALRLPDSAIRVELRSMNEQKLAKTASRSVLGTMNEFGHLADNYRWMHDYIDLVDLAVWLSQVPCRPLFSGEGTPGDELRARLS
jgi:hypothetical protein